MDISREYERAGRDPKNLELLEKNGFTAYVRAVRRSLSREKYSSG